MNMTGPCPLCKGSIVANLSEREWYVGECPWCKDTVYYINVPFDAGGSIGPKMVASHVKFYFAIKHLGDRYVRIRKGKEAAV